MNSKSENGIEYTVKKSELVRYNQGCVFNCAAMNHISSTMGVRVDVGWVAKYYGSGKTRLLYVFMLLFSFGTRIHLISNMSNI